MEYTQVLQLIGSYGFPVIACCCMAWFVWNQMKSHREEVGELRKAIDANTEIVKTLVRLLGHGGDDV